MIDQALKKRIWLVDQSSILLLKDDLVQSSDPNNTKKSERNKGKKFISCKWNYMVCSWVMGFFRFSKTFFFLDFLNMLKMKRNVLDWPKYYTINCFKKREVIGVLPSEGRHLKLAWILRTWPPPPFFFNTLISLIFAWLSFILCLLRTTTVQLPYVVPVSPTPHITVQRQR